MTAESESLRIGWAQVNLTPDEPVLLAGQFHARLSEGVADPITATVLVLDSGEDHCVWVSCDVVTISEVLRDGVREQVAGTDGLDPMKVVLNATHTHTAPEVRVTVEGAANVSGKIGVELSHLPAEDYIAFATERIAQGVRNAWDSRSPGSVAYGQGYAVVGRNRRWVSLSGVSNMYGNTNTAEFSHIEGYEDHSVNVLATYDAEGALTGVVVNVPSSSQVTEGDYQVSADYWHEARIELRRRLGQSLFVLPQCSAAGDQSPHYIFDKAAIARMFELKGRTEREDIAHRIANAVEETLDPIAATRESSLRLQHVVQRIALPMNQLTEDDVSTALGEAEKLEAEYEQEIARLERDPQAKKDPRWYRTATRAFRRARWYRAVADRFEQQKTNSTLETEVHVIRLGDIVFATNRFEYYLDFGIRIKARSPAVQTFLVQLAGPGTYVPSPRSVAGGGYGSVPASNPVGPEGGKLLADTTVEMIESLWKDTET